MIKSFAISILAALFCYFPLKANTTSLEGMRPNILLINIDDIDAADLGCYGAKHVSTPNMDELAATGIRFRTAFTPSMCGPSRKALATGRLAPATGHWHNDGVYNLNTNKDYETVYNIMHRAGYKTMVAGKWDGGKGLLPDYFDEAYIYARNIRYVPDGHSYDGPVNPTSGMAARYYKPLLFRQGKYIPTTAEDYGPDMLSDYVIDFINRNQHSNQPLMMYYSMLLCHGENALKHLKGTFPPVPDPANPGEKLDNGHNGMKEYIDYIVGKLLETLEETGLRENTIIVLMGDNGCYGPRGKGKAYEQGSWVPFIVNCPGTIPAKGLVDEMVSSADILPTFAELAGVKFPTDIDGISFLPVLEGKKGKREYVISYIGREAIIRDERWLLERYNSPEGGMLFWDCGNITAGNSNEDPNLYYKNLTNSTNPEALKAKQRLMDILKDFKIPEDGLLNPVKNQ